MRRFMTGLRGTSLATTLFILASITIWWKLLDWESAREHLLPTLFVSPVIWWLAIGRKCPTHPLRGVAAGALAGFLAQMSPHLPFVLSICSNPGTGDGEAQAAATMSMVIYLMIGFWALLIGGLLGLVAALIQRSLDRSRPATLSGAQTAAEYRNRAA